MTSVANTMFLVVGCEAARCFQAQWRCGCVCVDGELLVLLWCGVIVRKTTFCARFALFSLQAAGLVVTGNVSKLKKDRERK